MTNCKTYFSPAEGFFINGGYSMVLYRQLFDDERWKHIEGEFRLKDGSRLIEVKTDTLCLAPNGTERIPIELFHPGHTDGKGWYDHCHINGVTDILFFCTEGKGGKLNCIIDIPFAALREFVEAKRKDADYMRRYCKSTAGGTKNLCIPLDDLYHIPGTRWIKPLDGLVLKGTSNHDEV